ncbi:uncharacterized protein LOC124161377 [Ischnura elegans]|uniref:uncharacterized protein LOC124161377 n=1 Tax=Ischnura elegans TaxID=197161 RepID=UPI001ED8BC89|nr:uncharacterized protein LOC124161377 [Ischnura elegans]
MPSECVKCGSSIKRNQKQLTCDTCKRLYHPHCASLSDTDLQTLVELQKTWSCDVCIGESRNLRGDNTPVRATGHSAPSRTSPENADDPLAELLHRMKQLQEDHGDLKKTFITWQDTFNDQTALLEQVNGKLDTLKEDQKKLTQKVSENSELLTGLSSKFVLIEEELSKVKGAVNVLQEKANDLDLKLNKAEQSTLKNSVEIRGVPLFQDDDIQSVVIKICSFLGVHVSAEDIDGVFRPRPRHNSDSGTHAPPIIVRFVRQSKKNEVIVKRRAKKNFSSKDAGCFSDSTSLSQINQTIYIDEALTKYNRKIFALARGLKKEGKLKFVWVKNGKILVRQSETGPVVVIESQRDLDLFL